MKHLVELASSRLYNVPLLVTPEKLAAIMAVVSRGDLQNLEAATVDERLIETAMAPQAREVRPGAAGIAIVPIVGSLVARSSGFGSGSGLRSYASIRRELQAAMNDPEIGGIMLDIDSHGGEVAGCFALADLIREMSASKPIFAHANESAYSAGYALCSAANRVFVAPTSGAGSVGVVMQHVDQSAFNKKVGVNVQYIYSGAKKINGNPHGPLSKDVREELQARVDSLRLMFADKVDAFRGLPAGTAMATEAGTYLGEDIVTAGLADAVATWDQALEELSAEIQRYGRRKTMTTRDRMAALIASNEDAVEALAELGFVAASQPAGVAEEEVKERVSAAVADAFIEGDKAGFERAKEEDKMICEMCELAGVPEMAKAVIGERADLESARTMILNEKAVIDGKNTIASMVGAGVKKSSGFAEYMKKRHAATA